MEMVRPSRPFLKPEMQVPGGCRVGTAGDRVLCRALASLSVSRLLIGPWFLV